MSGEKTPSASTLIVNLALDRYRFGCTSDGAAFAVPIDGGHVVRMLKGGQVSLRSELAAAYRQVAGRVAPQQALADAMLTLQGIAEEADPELVALRVAEHAYGSIWLDVGDKRETLVKVTARGWEVIPHGTGPVLFRRTALTSAMPIPERGGDLDELWSLLNVAKEDRPLVLAWLVSALVRPDIPHPVLALFGEQGTGKSTAARMLTSLVDPSPVQLRKPPKDPEGWVTAAAGSWVVGLDNLSTVRPWFSDSLCRAVTGDGDVRRALYTDGDVSVFAFRRVVLLNGIDVGAMAGDLADRAMVVNLERIDEANRLTEADLTIAWTAARPRILGALLDECVRVLALLPTIRLEAKPRMADFALVLGALDECHATEGLSRYSEQGANLAAETLDAEPFIEAMAKSLDGPFVGTAAELRVLVDQPSDAKTWPTAREVTTLLKRNAPTLRRLGWDVEQISDRAGSGRVSRAVRWRVGPPETVGNERDRCD